MYLPFYIFLQLRELQLVRMSKFGFSSFLSASMQKMLP
jgi:hypothetical protein